ncbi:hypothetical protein SynPROS91_00856 [Synechococcus sp. PROS-9-1]|nr:hypothetical protein SynPROS91_00856 [Synechococcus sp. PROS-9-1]
MVEAPPSRKSIRLKFLFRIAGDVRCLPCVHAALLLTMLFQI